MQVSNNHKKLQQKRKLVCSHLLGIRYCGHCGHSVSFTNSSSLAMGAWGALLKRE